MEDNDTIRPSENFIKEQSEQRIKPDDQAMSAQIGSIKYIQHYGQMLIDPFGLLRRVIATATLPKIIEELSLYIMISLTTLWDFIIVMTVSTVVFKLLTVIFYCIRKLSRLLCLISSGKNKRALRRVIWNQQQPNVASSRTKQLPSDIEKAL